MTAADLDAASAAADAAAAPVRERRPSRLPELMLLVVALALGVGAYALVSVRILGTLPTDFYTHCGVFALIVLVAHLVLRRRAPYADQILLPVAVALNGLGLAMIYRLDLAAQARGIDRELAIRQLLWTLIAVACCLAVVWFLRDHRWLRRFTYVAMLLGLVLVALPLVPGVGRTINGARIWISVGPLSLQPAELAKIAFAVFFAGYLVTRRESLAVAGPKVLGMHLPRMQDLGPILVVWLASVALLVLETDLGTSMLLFGLFVAMLYIATERVSWVVIGLGLAAAGAFAAARAFPHVQTRFTIWLHPFDSAVFNATPGSGQLVRGLFGLANGGMIGTGWGAGYPQLVPFAFSDFIYTSLGEELGLTGMIAILLLYLLLVQRGFRAATGVRDGFGKLLAGGLAFVVAWQLFVVVGGVTRLIPLTGLTMPFVAQGGSSLLANWIIVGILLRISDSARRPSTAPQRGEVASGRAIVEGDESANGDGSEDPGEAGTGADDAASGSEAAGAPGGAHPTDAPTEVVR